MITITFEVANAPTAMQKSSAAAVTMRPVCSSPTATASRFGSPAVPLFLDPRQEKDAVVGREPERDRKEQHGLRQLQRALAAVGEQAFEAPVLEDEDEDARCVAKSDNAFISSVFSGSTSERVAR